MVPDSNIFYKQMIDGEAKRGPTEFASAGNIQLFENRRRERIYRTGNEG